MPERWLIISQAHYRVNSGPGCESSGPLVGGGGSLILDIDGLGYAPMESSVECLVDAGLLPRLAVGVCMTRGEASAGTYLTHESVSRLVREGEFYDKN